MTQNQYSKHDVLVIGGGGAGLRAAIAIAETNPSLSVALVSKVYPMRSHTVAAEGGAAAVINDNDSLDDHSMDTITGHVNHGVVPHVLPHTGKVVDHRDAQRLQLVRWTDPRKHEDLGRPDGP